MRLNLRTLRGCSVLFVLVLLRCVHTGKVVQSTLYDENDKVVLLDATNLKETIYGSSKVWIVEFFSSWCGHCIHFAPLWKQFAQDVWGWNHLVSVAGIDCADEDNVPTCREYEIMAYPTIRKFPVNAKSSIKKAESEENSLNVGEDFGRHEAIGSMKKMLMDFLVSVFPLLYDQPATSEYTEIKSVWNAVASNRSAHGFTTDLVVLVYENASSYIGKEVALDLSKYTNIQVIGFHSKNSFLNDLKIIEENWPVVAYIDKHLELKPISMPTNENLVPYIISAVKEIPGISFHPVTSKSESKVTKASEHIVKDVSVSGPQSESALGDKDVVSMEDLLRSLRNALRNEVGLFKNIDGSRLDDLKTFTGALVDYFPADRKEIKYFLVDLNSWLNSQTNLKGSTYMEKINALEEKYRPWNTDLETWFDCKESLPGRRGYTCGLWRLFHSLTLINLQRESDGAVLKAIHGYVRSFFGCSECRNHFTSMVNRDHVLSIDGARNQVLWLWKAHNEVNIRLHNQGREDPLHPKENYPTKSLCPSCFLSNGKYIENEVVDYLMRIYANPVRLDKRNGLWSSHQKLVNRNPSASSFFSVTDYGLFFFVYIAIASLLILVYLSFKLKARKPLSASIVVLKTLCCSNSNKGDSKSLV